MLEAKPLQQDQSFRSPARVLKMTRFVVGWEATGYAMGAYENALKYCQECLQFAKPIASFQTVQDLLANITASPYLLVCITCQSVHQGAKQTNGC